MKGTVAIILGGGIAEDGTLPSWAVDRVKLSHALWRDGRVESVLFSGKGRDGFAVAEAESMRDLFVELGGDIHATMCECLSRDTIQNAYYSRKIHLEQLSFTSAIVITSEFHMERSRMIFDQLCGDILELEYETVSDRELDQEALKHRIYTEGEQISFCNEFLASMEQGDMRSVYQFIFNADDHYHKLYRELGNRLRARMQLY